jgi:hypothetical protein
MSPITAYILGILTLLIILIPFWILSTRFTAVANTWNIIMCNQTVKTE